MLIIDAHIHLWEIQLGMVNGKPVRGMGGGRSDFGGEIRQMLPPYMYDDKNTVKMLLSNMDYSCVSGAVVTQEYIDGNQNEYLLKAKAEYTDRLKICSLYEEDGLPAIEGFDGVKICAGRLANQDLTSIAHVFKFIEESGRFLSIDLADGDLQVGSLREMIEYCPNLKIAIGHFGMVTRAAWQEQIKLASCKNVYIESGGITWLFNDEFYPFTGAIRAIKEAADLCGIEKLMWGSDYPRTMTAITYNMSFDFVLKTEELSFGEKESFLGKNACGFYNFDFKTELTRVKNMVE